MSYGYICDGCSNHSTDTDEVVRNWWQVSMPKARKPLSSIEQLLGVSPSRQPTHAFCTARCLARWAVAETADAEFNRMVQDEDIVDWGRPR